MSCESGGVKVDHACSVPNSGPMVTSFGFENRASPAQRLECGGSRFRYGCRSSQADKADVIEAVTDLCWLEQGHAPQPIDRDWWRAATVREGRK